MKKKKKIILALGFFGLLMCLFIYNSRITKNIIENSLDWKNNERDPEIFEGTYNK